MLYFPAKCHIHLQKVSFGKVRKTVKKNILSAAAISIIALMTLRPDSSIMYAKQALDICYEVIIPSLFPFFVCSGILVYSGFAESLSRLFRPVMKPLFNINSNGAAAFVLGILSGYPLGAVTVCQLYENAYLSKSEAERLLAFCNNSGPLFILGAVGAAMYKSPKIGIMLYISHIIAAIITGVIFRFYDRDKFCAPKSRLATAENLPAEIFSKVLANSINSILTVCGAIVFFFTASGIVLGIMRLTPPLNAFVSSLLEMTGGIKKISALSLSLDAKLAISSFCVGFAGICVHIQVMAVTARYGFSLKPYLVGKVLHGTLSALFTYILFNIFPQTASVFSGSGTKMSGGFCFGSMYVIFSILVLIALSLVMPILKKRT